MYHAIALLVAAVVVSATDTPKPASPPAATIVVATHDSSVRSKSLADFVGDGNGDQEEINAAIRALPEPGGTVMLMEGTYDIRRVEGKLGGVLIERSNVTLAGQGAATKLIQAPEQETNVIRIIGSGVGHITIRDVYVDANRDQNPVGEGDPNVSHARFEFCGIKAYYQEPGGPGGEPNHNITIENCYVLNARRLGIMLEGSNMRVLNNVLGNAMSDSVEILTGPGEIRGNYVEITGRTHVAIGSDRGDNIIMANNVVHVKEGGDIDIGFRSWADSHRHVITDNVLTVDPGGKCGKAVDARGFGAVISGNNFYSSTEKLVLSVGAGNSIVSGNILDNVVVEVDDTTGANKPILINTNILENSEIVVKNGNVNPAEGSDS
ncbi:MAG: right-handed parallel beta-helix repeat-containing protein [Candidatus Hydrogenedentes bacterium]|nr:right-handed parallel beta-helix repeat-containing protein [Candidatus Hydrogenedentota bacterium]